MLVKVMLLGCCTATLNVICPFSHTGLPKHRKNDTTGKNWQSVVHDDDEQLKPQPCQRLFDELLLVKFRICVHQRF
jgi:hypothetical protein